MEILIVGAGPAGLTAAVELARRGIRARIIDKKSTPSTLSRAVGIHAHTLDLLEPCGATEKLLAEGIRVRHFVLHKSRGRTQTIDFGRLDHRFNFVLALPQDRTESILIDRLQAYGGAVEFGTELTRLVNGKTQATATTVTDNRQSTADYDLVIGADGFRSRVRDSAGIAMTGVSEPEEWGIADFDCHALPYERNAAHLFPQKDGRIAFLIPIGPDRYRAIANRADALAELPRGVPVDKIHVANSFHIAVKFADAFRCGPSFLIGDAAHIHSPAGGRGMNDGMEDACALAARIAAGTQDGYETERRAVDLATLRLTERARAIGAAATPWHRCGRTVGFILIRLPAVQRTITRRMAGL